MFDLQSLVRENIRNLVPYSSARGEFQGTARIFLDANENSFGSPINRNYSRYPDPLQSKIKERVAELNNVSPSQIFVGNGSDEAIDLLIRVFCRPAVDSVVVCPPTYGMYEVSAAINDVAVQRANLTPAFELDVDAVKERLKPETKLIFLCSPNNPTGNLLGEEAIFDVLRSFNGIVVVDEAYIHFSGKQSLINRLSDYPNLVILQTFSKAWGLAGLRVGLAFGSPKIIGLLNCVKPPYNVSEVAQEQVLSAISKESKVVETVDAIVRQRTELSARLAELSIVSTVYRSDANFLLVRVENAKSIYEFLLDQKIVVRNRSSVVLCDECLRITVGTPDENTLLIEALKEYEKSAVH